jgi:ATP-dependent helicase HrpB
MTGATDLCLPIESLRDDVRAALGRRPLVIAAPTGSGKSTRVPLWCREDAGGLVLVVEPRRVACRSLARYVAGLVGEPVGESVGYTVRFEDASGPGTRVRYVTPGVALQWAAGDEMRAPAVFILDEFHERGWETDLFLALARRLRPEAPLVVMSATLEAEALAERLGGRVLRASGTLYPVETRYLGGPMVPTLRRLEERAVEGVRRALWETEGDILVFLPGKGEINACRDRLGRLAGVEVLPLHGTLPAAELDRVFQPDCSGRARRVILATNVAETSVTVPGITAVVDGGLARQRLHRARRSVLATVAISRAAADQRRGRAGRLGPGVCYRLWDERGVLEPATPPEIRRVPLAPLLLAAAAAGCSLEELALPDPPPPFAGAEAQEQLLRWGALDAQGALTALGARLFRLPVDPAYARLLAEAPRAVARDLCDLIASLEVRAPFFRSLDGLEAEPRASVTERRASELLPVRCDATARILTLRRGDVSRHHLHATALEEARRIADQLRALLDLPPVKEEIGPAKPVRTALIDALLAQWPDAAYVRRRRGDAWGNGEDEIVLGRDSLVPAEAEAIVVLEKENLATNGPRVQARAATAIPCGFADLRRAGLGTATAETPVLENGLWVAEVVLTYAGREIARERRELSGALLRAALAERIVAGRLFPGLASEIEERISAEQLHRALAGQPVTPRDTRVWLEERLTVLGVEAPEDWALIEVEDLRDDAIDEAGLAALRERYPATFTHGNAVFAVAYDPARRLVTLHWKSGFRRVAIPPHALPRWHDWSVQVMEKGEVRTVR